MHKIPHSRSTLENDDYDNVLQSLHRNCIAAGRTKERFVEALSFYLQQEQVELFSSGTSAFYCILRALKIGNGDEVLIPNYICRSVLKPIQIVGAIPILYDNSLRSWLASSDEIKKKVSAKTKVILINHTFGIRMDVDKGLRQFQIPIVEDCCHRMKRGDEDYQNGVLCSFYSFNATKLLATGEGGAVTTNDRYFADALKSKTIDNGLSDLNCSLGLGQLLKYDSFLCQRRIIADRYRKAFQALKNIKIVGKDSVFFRFPILSNNANSFFNSEKVSFRKGVDSLLSNFLKIGSGGLENSIDVYTKTVSLPIYPSLTKAEQDVVIDEVFNIVS